MVFVRNIKELSKKEKIKGLSRKAWIILMAIGTISFIAFFLYGLIITALAAIVLAILEHIDEDICDIVIIKMTNKFQDKYYA